MSFRGAIFDLDGTLYRGSEPVPQAAEVVRTLVDQGKSVRYLTNNSTATPEDVVRKLEAWGFPVTPDWVATSGTVTATALAQLGIKRAFVVGEPALEAALSNAGIQVSRDSDAEVVVAGLCRSFSYAMLNDALQVLAKGAKLIATNADPQLPIEGGGIRPGAGSIVAALEAASGQTATCYGKPSPTGVLELCQGMKLDPFEVVVVGDRYETDIRAGLAAACQVLLVPTGLSQGHWPGVRQGALSELLAW